MEVKHNMLWLMKHEVYSKGITKMVKTSADTNLQAPVHVLVIPKVKDGAMPSMHE